MILAIIDLSKQKVSLCRLLPVALIASFIKRLARLCLRAPPAAIITIIPFVYNQLKRHPALMTLIHSPTIPEADVVYEGQSA